VSDAAPAVERWLAWRYLATRQREGFVSFIALFSLVGVALGVATLIGFVLPLTYILNWALNRICPFRVAIEGERQGMDLYELGAGAYPEFITHTEDFIPR